MMAAIVRPADGLLVRRPQPPFIIGLVDQPAADERRCRRAADGAEHRERASRDECEDPRAPPQKDERAVADGPQEIVRKNFARVAPELMALQRNQAAQEAAGG